MAPSASGHIATGFDGIGGIGAFSDAFLDGESLRHDTPLWRQLDRLRRTAPASLRPSRQTAARNLGGDEAAAAAEAALRLGNDGGLPRSVVYKLLQDPYFLPSFWPKGDIGRKRIVAVKVIFL